MGFVNCALPHPLVIVLTMRCLETAEKDYPGLPFPQNAAEVEADLAAMRGVFTLVDDRQADNPRVSFCTPRYELVCALTQQQDAWFVIRISPLGLRTHNLIARGALKLETQGWQVFTDLVEINRQGSAPTGVDELLSAWKQVRGPDGKIPAPVSASAGLSPAQVAFLANVDTLIDLAQEVELEQAARQERIPVRAAEALAGSIGRFALSAGGAGIRVGEYWRVGYGEAGVGADGVVTEATSSAVKIRFFQPIEAAFLQKVQWLTPKISTKQYAIQHAAVRALQNGESLNPALLGLIVDGRFARYSAPSTDRSGQGPAISTSGERPNPAQKLMIERALVVPDLLLALGPPGTGKTDTIREIVARQAALGKKVLVTSKNNKAVDNVLEGLAGVHALRIGREEVVSPEVRPLLIDNRSSAMQGAILAGSQATLAALDSALAAWPDAQQALEAFAQLSDAVLAAENALEEKRAELLHWQTAAYMRVEGTLARQETHARLLEARLAEAARRAEALRRQLERMGRWSKFPLLGGLFVLLAARLAEDWQIAFADYNQLQADLRKARENARRVWESYRQFVTAGELALTFKRGLQAAEEHLEMMKEELRGAVEKIESIAQPNPPAPFPGREEGAGFPPPPKREGVRDFSAFAAELRTRHERQLRRRGLLAEWRETIQTRPQALYPTLIRSADVVGATCIGVATDARFEDLEFDLVIADEAGQIQVMDLLVPLVRARRAVLVGDHLQLPPLVEPEISEKIREREPENAELGEWLEKSLFERLIQAPGTPVSHKVMLDTQYRMPRPIADFISTQFYGGNYRTGRDIPHADPFFGSPLVFIDTMKEVRHFEQRATDGQGYSNPTEAHIISDLVLAYAQKGIEAGVIVPYKNQAEAIRRELRRRDPTLGEDALITRIATVDSFQGREQDVILFGFTRSNADGRIGFLTELRRLNVSLTRARRQLVLVGDSLTLTSTPDAPFARLAQSLVERVRKLPKAYLQSSELTHLFD